MTQASDLKKGDQITITLSAVVVRSSNQGYTSLKFNGDHLDLYMKNATLDHPTAKIVVNKRPVAVGDRYTYLGREYTIIAVDGEYCWWKTVDPYANATCLCDVFLDSKYKLVDK